MVFLWYLFASLYSAPSRQIGIKLHTTTLDGSTFPRTKIDCFSQLHFFLANQNTTGYSRDQCCHQQSNGVPIEFGKIKVSVLATFLNTKWGMQMERQPRKEGKDTALLFLNFDRNFCLVFCVPSSRTVLAIFRWAPLFLFSCGKNFNYFISLVANSGPVTLSRPFYVTTSLFSFVTRSSEMWPGRPRRPRSCPGTAWRPRSPASWRRRRTTARWPGTRRRSLKWWRHLSSCRSFAID